MSGAAKVVRSLPGRRHARHAEAEARRPRRRPDVGGVPALANPRTPARVARGTEAVAKPRAVVPRLRELHGRAGRPGAQRSRYQRPRGEHDRGPLVGPRLPPRREGYHGKAVALGAIDARPADCRRPRRRAWREGAEPGGADRYLPDARGTVRSAGARGTRRP